MVDHDDDDVGDGDVSSGLYRDGHWTWRDNEGLVFVSEYREESPMTLSINMDTAGAEFHELDVIEQERFNKRFRRKVKTGDPDVVTLQDIKDIVIYTAPLSLLSPSVIKMLHIPTTERFIRALILYCQYYLQILDELKLRELELENKIKTPQSEIVESQYAQDLTDIRTVVAKEYCIMVMGEADTRAFHHMGPEKRTRSLSDKDRVMYELLLRLCVQTVWLALGRVSFKLIEEEINHMMRTDVYNTAAHLRSGNVLSNEHRMILHDDCPENNLSIKLHSRSPLLRTIKCNKRNNYQLMGIGIVDIPHLNYRLQFMLRAISSPEAELIGYDISLGILGMPRAEFDTMLFPIVVSTSSKSKLSCSAYSQSFSATQSQSHKSVAASRSKIYSMLQLPLDESDPIEYSSPFPTKSVPRRAVDEQKCRLWLDRLARQKSSLSMRRLARDYAF